MKKEIKTTNDQRLSGLNIPKINSDIFPVNALKKATKITLLEKFALLFCKKKISTDKPEFTILVYKLFRGKLYVLEHYYNPPMHPICRCN